MSKRRKESLYRPYIPLGYVRKSDPLFGQVRRFHEKYCLMPGKGYMPGSYLKFWYTAPENYAQALFLHLTARLIGKIPFPHGASV